MHRRRLLQHGNALSPGDGNKASAETATGHARAALPGEGFVQHIGQRIHGRHAHLEILPQRGMRGAQALAQHPQVSLAQRLHCRERARVLAKHMACTAQQHGIKAG